MNRLTPRLLVLMAVAAFSIPALANADPHLRQVFHVRGGPWLLAGRVYESSHRSPHPHLILVLHGDAPFTNPWYQNEFAKRAATAMDDVVVAALLRPGYSDGRGLASEGRIGWKLDDNYTRDRIDSIAAAAAALVNSHRAADLTLVGHSGGSAIAADILALHPGLARRALLVSCPCDVPAFRSNMLRLQWNPLWLLPQWSISPRDQVAAIPGGTQISRVVGADDPVTPARLSAAFADAIRAKGGQVRVTILPRLGHEILPEPQVLIQLRALLNDTQLKNCFALVETPGGVTSADFLEMFMLRRLSPIAP